MIKKFFILFVISIGTCVAAPTQWQTISPGLEYTKLPLSRVSNQGILHAFRIDPNQYRFDLVFAKDHQAKALSVSRLAKAERAIIAVNGGFFSPTYDPLGLRIKNGKKRSSLKNTTWWGVFMIKDNKPQIVSQENYEESFKDSDIDLAIQAGPRLVIEHQIPSLKDGYAERTAIGITDDGKIILVTTQNAPITTTQLAQVMNKSTADGGLNVANALNFDGGSSSQMFAKYNQLYINVINFGLVTDGFVVKSFHE